MVWSQYSILNIVIHGAQTPKYKNCLCCSSARILSWSQLFMIKIREYHFIWYLIAVSLSNIVMVRKTYWFLPFIIFRTVLNQSFSTTVKATILGKGIENHIDLQNSKYQIYYNQYAYMNSSQNTNTPLTLSSCVHICEKPGRCNKGYLGFPHNRWNWLNRSKIWEKSDGNAFWI